MSDHPAPEVPARPATDEEIARVGNRETRALIGAAEAGGWAVRVTYARGTRLGRPARVVESVALRMNHPDRGRAVAVWVDGKWSIGLVAAAHLFPSSLGAKDFKKWIKNE